MELKTLEDKDVRNTILAALDAFEKCCPDPVLKSDCRKVYREIQDVGNSVTEWKIPQINSYDIIKRKI